MLRLIKELFRGPPKRDSMVFIQKRRPNANLQVGDLWIETDLWGNGTGPMYVWTKRKTWKEIKYEADK